MDLVKRTAARVLAIVIVPLVLAACGQGTRASAVAPAAKDVTRTGNPYVHVILTVPEGVETPETLVDTTIDAQDSAPATLLATSPATPPATPWVRSVKREAPSGFAALATRGFADDVALETWQKAHAAQLNSPLVLKRARVLTQSESPATGSASSIFKISYYSLAAPVSEFEAWVDGYLAKYLSSQRSGGILSSYSMYLEEGEQGRALLVLEYPDADTEQSAEPIKAKLSEELAASDAVYAAQLMKKEELRTTQSWTLAVPIAADGG